MGRYKVEGVSGNDPAGVVQVGTAESGVVVRCPGGASAQLVNFARKGEVHAPRDAAVQAVGEAGVRWRVKGCWSAHACKVVHYHHLLCTCPSGCQYL